MRPRPRASLFGLAPCGVLPATSVTRSAVRSYRTFSPLPAFALGPLGSRTTARQAQWPHTRDSFESLPRRSSRRRRRRERRRAVSFLCHWSVGLPRPGVTRRTVLVEFGLSSPGAGPPRPRLVAEPRAQGLTPAAVVWSAAASSVYTLRRLRWVASWHREGRVAGFAGSARTTGVARGRREMRGRDRLAQNAGLGGIARALLHCMDAIRSFRDLEVWQRSMDLVDLVFEATRAFPVQEFDLRRQARDAARSIPANVAEGWRRKSAARPTRTTSRLRWDRRESWRRTWRLRFAKAGCSERCGATLSRCLPASAGCWTTCMMLSAEGRVSATEAPDCCSPSASRSRRTKPSRSAKEASRLPTELSPVRLLANRGTAPASCTGCCAACR